MQTANVNDVGRKCAMLSVRTVSALGRAIIIVASATRRENNHKRKHYYIVSVFRYTLHGVRSTLYLNLICPIIQYLHIVKPRVSSKHTHMNEQST